MLAQASASSLSAPSSVVAKADIFVLWKPKYGKKTA
jgi:hypothetical protein